jgi:hypothetical protein
VVVLGLTVEFLNTFSLNLYQNLFPMCDKTTPEIGRCPSGIRLSLVSVAVPSDFVCKWAYLRLHFGVIATGVVALVS